jgi:hypothetical protein
MRTKLGGVNGQIGLVVVLFYVLEGLGVVVLWRNSPIERSVYTL